MPVQVLCSTIIQYHKYLDNHTVIRKGGKKISSKEDTNGRWITFSTMDFRKGSVTFCSVTIKDTWGVSTYAQMPAKDYSFTVKKQYKFLGVLVHRE